MYKYIRSVYSYISDNMVMIHIMAGAIKGAMAPKTGLNGMLRTAPTAAATTSTAVVHPSYFTITNTAPKAVMTTTAAATPTTGLNILNAQNIALGEQVLIDVAGVIIVTSAVAAMASSLLPKSR